MTIVAELLRLLAAVMLPVQADAIGNAGLVGLAIVTGLALAAGVAVVLVAVVLAVMSGRGRATRRAAPLDGAAERPLQSRPDAPGRRLPRAPGVTSAA